VLDEEAIERVRESLLASSPPDAAFRTHLKAYLASGAIPSEAPESFVNRLSLLGIPNLCLCRRVLDDETLGEGELEEEAALELHLAKFSS
jgi:hypothetical protein